MSWIIERVSSKVNEGGKIHILSILVGGSGPGERAALSAPCLPEVILALKPKARGGKPSGRSLGHGSLGEPCLLLGLRWLVLVACSNCRDFLIRFLIKAIIIYCLVEVFIMGAS